MRMAASGNMIGQHPALTTGMRLMRLPGRLVRTFVHHRHLITQMTRRQVQARYRGSWLGLTWSLLNPLLMLGVYFFVFSVVYQSRWDTAGDQSQADFAIIMFASLLPFNIFAETVNSSPSLILENINYVKRVVFPLHVLPVTRLMTSMAFGGFGFLMMLSAMLVLKGSIPLTVLWAPLMLVPLALLALGLSYFLSALGVFVRDVGHVVVLVTTMLMFLSPIFYPLSRLPASWRGMLALNPLATIIENFRLVSALGMQPIWSDWVWNTLVGGVVLVLGMAFFMKCRRAFADVM